jgi:phage portal protein BeeE
VAERALTRRRRMNAFEVMRSGGPNPWPAITLDQLPYWFGTFGYEGLGYGPAMIQTLQQNRETIAADFLGFINGAYKTNGAIFGCMLARMALFSEARFQFRRMQNGRPGKLFGTPDLDILEHPWPNATTGDLLARIVNDVDLAGNWYGTRTPRLDRHGSKIGRLRPDWVTIIKGSTHDPPTDGEFKADLTESWDPSAELIGYIYTPGGPGSGMKPRAYLPEEVAHIAPIPDPIASYRGMSWVQPILTEVLGDRAMTTHKIMFFENGASGNLVVSLDTGRMDRKTFKEWIDLFESEHAGAMNAFKTVYLGQGAQVTPVGFNMRDLDYSAVQGQGELRIAEAAGIHPVILGTKDGLAAASLNNFQNARRLTGDKTLRPLWRNTCGSLETLVPPPPGSNLWYDDTDIPFLKDDQADQANVILTLSTAMRLLTDAGYDPDSVVQAVEANDLSLLEHSGLFSVQLHPPGQNDLSGSENGNSNGNGNGDGNGKAAPNSPLVTKGQLLPDKAALLAAGVTDVQGLALALLKNGDASE